MKYVPAPGENGRDAFTVRVCDPEGGCSSAVVEVTVAPVNDVPVVTVEDGGAVLSGRVGDVVVLQAAVSDVEMGTLSVRWAQTGGPTVATSVVGPRLSFTPTAVGTYAFTVTVCDSDGGCTEQVLAVEVGASDAPAVTPSRSLARTGGETAATGLAALLLLVTGGALVGIARRVAQR